MFKLKDVTIPAAGDYILGRARVPACLLAARDVCAEADGDGALLLDLRVRNGRIAAISAARTQHDAETPVIDLHGRQVWPTLVDMHAHLDKGQVIPRCLPNGTIDWARSRTAQDRDIWTADDIYRRMSFGVRCAYVHGVAAIRTHIDSHEGQAERSWEVFETLRD
jgi:cytosine deaminase